MDITGATQLLTDARLMTVITGVLVAAVYSGFVFLVGLVRGPVFFQEVGLTLSQLVGLYFASGLIGGLIVAVLLPLGRTLVGAIIIGYIAALPVMGMFALAYFGASQWRPKGLTIMVICSLIGAPVGAQVWNEQIGKRGR